MVGLMVGLEMAAVSVTWKMVSVTWKWCRLLGECQTRSHCCGLLSVCVRRKILFTGLCFQYPSPPVCNHGLNRDDPPVI